MKKTVKFVMFYIVTISFLLLFPRVVSAQVDIELIENEEDSSLSILVDSNESYVDGLVLEIIHPLEVVIDEDNVIKSEELCTINNTLSLRGNSFSIECFNDQNTVMKGEIAKIPFSTELDNYFFYLDQDLLDIGLLSLGTVTDINRPDNVIFEDFEFTEEGETDPVSVESEEIDGTLEKIRSFLTENTLYVLIGVITLISVAIIIVFITSGKEKTEEPIQ